MKRLFIVGLGLFLCSINVKAQTGWEEEGLKNYVSEMKQRCYVAIETASGNIVKGDLAYCLAGNEDYTFDQRGRRTGTSGYDLDKNIDWIAVYSYPLEDKAEMHMKSGSGGLRSKSVYTYNDAGRLIEENLYGAQGELREKMTYTYDARGINKIVVSCYKPTGELRWREDYEYNNAGEKTGYKHYDSQGNLEWQTVYKYDTNGNIIEEGSYDINGAEISHHAYEYVFDDYNWIQRITFVFDINGNKIPENIVERELAYY